MANGMGNLRIQSRSDNTCQTIPKSPEIKTIPDMNTRRIIASGHLSDAIFLLLATYPKQSMSC